MSDTTIHQVVAAIRDAHPAMCDSKGDIVLSCDVGTDWAVIRDCEAAITQTQIDRASLALRGITEQARAWNWGNVEHKLDCAYAALGSKNPGTGYDYHCGNHPVEIAATEFSFAA
jgi:hypothetical protein